jgi:hypothetical protein
MLLLLLGWEIFVDAIQVVNRLLNDFSWDAKAEDILHRSNSFTSYYIRNAKSNPTIQALFKEVQ